MVTELRLTLTTLYSVLLNELEEVSRKVEVRSPPPNTMSAIKSYNVFHHLFPLLHVVYRADVNSVVHYRKRLKSSTSWIPTSPFVRSSRLAINPL